MTSVRPFVTGDDKSRGLTVAVASTINNRPVTASVLFGFLTAFAYAASVTAVDYAPAAVPRLYVSFAPEVATIALPASAVAPVGGLVLFILGVAFGIFLVEYRRPSRLEVGK